MMRIINEALEDILKHRMTSMLMVSIIAVSVFVSSLFLSLVFNLDSFQARWSHNVRLYVFTVESADLNLVQEEAKKITALATYFITARSLESASYQAELTTISSTPSIFSKSLLTLLSSLIPVRISIKEGTSVEEKATSCSGNFFFKISTASVEE